MFIEIDHDIEKESIIIIKENINKLADFVFQDIDNPIECVYIGDIEKKLLDLLSEEEKEARKKLNAEKSVFTVGKIISNVKNDTYCVTVLLNIGAIFTSDLFVSFLTHEMIHARDYKLYYDLVDKKPFLENDICIPNDLYEAYQYWTEYNANRISQEVINSLNTNQSIPYGSLKDDLDTLFLKLKKAKYEIVEQDDKNYIVQVACCDFNSRFLIISGQAAVNKEANKILIDFQKYGLTQKIFKNYFNLLPQMFDDIYCTSNFSEKILKIPLLMKEYNIIWDSLNKFSISDEY